MHRVVALKESERVMRHAQVDTQTRTHTKTHTHLHTYKHTHTHTHKHTHTHTHTHTQAALRFEDINEATVRTHGVIVYGA
jgi:hypothetical protein